MKMNASKLQGIILIGGAAFIAASIIRSRQVSKFKRDLKALPRYFVLPDHVEIHLLQQLDECNRVIDSWISKFEKKELQLIGLDTEWATDPGSKKQRAALVQIFDGERCLLVHPYHLKRIPEKLQQLLEDPSVLKSGVGIFNDVKILFEEYGIIVRGFVDLQALAYQYNYAEGGLSLANLSRNLLGIEIDKSPHIRCGDWAKLDLSSRQVMYASIDAWVSYELFTKMFELHGKNEDVMEWVSFFIDRKVSSLGSPKSGTSLSTVMAEKHLKRPKRKSALYENCRMLSPDGTLLCTCNKKKIQWYITKGIAELVDTNQLTIQLKFQPRGSGHAGDPYYLSQKENRCVVCGSEKEYSRHWICPHGYRVHFPEKIKSRSSHDIVLLCSSCAHKASVHVGQLKHQIARELGLPHTCGRKFEVDHLKQKIKSHTTALLNPKVPEQRKNEIIQQLKELGVDLSEDEFKDVEKIKELSNIDFRIEIPGHKSLEQLVVESLKTHQDLENFVQKWRKHFVESMQPKFLPPHWQIDKPLISFNDPLELESIEENPSIQRSDEN